MNCALSPSGLSADLRFSSQHVSVCLYNAVGTLSQLGRDSSRLQKKKKTKKPQPARLSPTNGISMASVILRCTILIYSGCFCVGLKCGTPARLMAHSTITSPLSEDASSHPAENDKYSKSVFVLDTCFVQAGAPAVSCCYGLCSLSNWQQCWQAKAEKKNRIYHAESPPALWKWTIWQHSAQQKHCFIFHLLSWAYWCVHYTRG